MATLGQGAQCYVLNITTVSDTNPHVSTISWLQHARCITYQLIANGTLDGAWKIEVSNDYSAAGGSAMGQAPNAGTWTDITAGFTSANGSAIPAVAHGTVATQNIAVQGGPVGFRAIRVTFTGTAGSGTVQAIVAGGEF